MTIMCSRDMEETVKDATGPKVRVFTETESMVRKFETEFGAEAGEFSKQVAKTPMDWPTKNDMLDLEVGDSVFFAQRAEHKNKQSFRAAIRMKCLSVRSTRTSHKVGEQRHRQRVFYKETFQWSFRAVYVTKDPQTGQPGFRLFRMDNTTRDPEGFAFTTRVKRHDMRVG